MPVAPPPVRRSSEPWSKRPGQTAARIWEGWFALDLIVEGGRCRGLVALDENGGVVELRAAHTLLATGGAGQLYAVTTNPLQSTGDGLAMALRAGVAVADVEFVQFHPTALHGSPAGPRPLLSEALRGEGALLRDHRGQRFVDELQPETWWLRPSPPVSEQDGVDHVWLDVSGVDVSGPIPQPGRGGARPGPRPGRRLASRRARRPLSLWRDLTDLDGATALPGLWAAGEAACTGVHGANRLASNSLLEGMVFGARAVEAVLSGKDSPARPVPFVPSSGRAPPSRGSRGQGAGQSRRIHRDPAVAQATRSRNGSCCSGQ